MKLVIWAAYRENERYTWCITKKDTYLYKLDRTRAVIEQVVPLSDDIYMYCAYNGILPYRNSLILIPANSDNVVIVDCRNLTKEYIALPDMKYRIGNSTSKFFGGVVHEDNLFLFGNSYPGIVKVNLISKDVKVIDSWINKSMVTFTNEYDGCFGARYILLNNVVYFPFMNTNAVLQFDLETENILVHKVGDESQRFVSIEWDGECFWLIPRDGSTGNVIKWNPFNGVIEYIKKYPEEFDYNTFAFYRTEMVNNKIFLFAHLSNCNISIDTNNGQMVTFPHLYHVEDIKGCKYQIVWREHDKFIILRDKEWIEWNYCRNTVERFDYKYDASIVQRYSEREIKEYFDNRIQKVIGEKENMSLKKYLRYLTIKQCDES